MSVASSDAHWSFENLTQSTDSGYPLIVSTSVSAVDLAKPRQQDPPLSLVIGSPDLRSRHSGPRLARAPSSTSSSTATGYQHRRNRPHSPRHARPPPEAMQPTGNGVYPPQGSTPRDSVYSDRAVFALSPQRSNTPSSQHHRESLSLPPTAPPAVYAVDSGSNHNHRHQQAASLPPVPPKHVSTMVALSPRRVLHLNQSSERPSPFEGGISFEAALAAGRGDAGAHKTYALPPGTDIAPSSAMQQTHRIRVERDYSAGDARQFALRVPDALAGRIDHQKFIQFVSRINAMLAKAEGATARNVLEGCLAYATLYLSTLVIKPHYKRAMDDISRYVYHENTTLFKPAGLLVIDPKQTAYMFIEIISL